MELFYREYGKGEPLLVLHGLFGSADNWMTQAKLLSEHFRVMTIDQRNHGLSPHHPEHDYLSMVEDLKDFFDQHKLDKAIVLGHSMGGKTAMNFALKYPSMVSKLIVVDIMPKAYPRHHDKILDGLKSLRLHELTSRNQADALLAKYVDEPDVRQFLLKNLSREQSGFSWKINLPVLNENIDEMGVGLVVKGQFNNPTLFIVGERSNYHAAGDEEMVKQYFPNSTWVEMETGHWVQAEKPKEFVEVALNFLK